jgi:1,2-diacylglycerol 3-beta-galactosyltransferase
MKGAENAHSADTGHPQTGTHRVLILTSDAGMGHRHAAEAIVAALRDRYGSKCQVEIVNPLEDARAPAALRQRQGTADTDKDHSLMVPYDQIVQNVPELYKFGYEASDGKVQIAVIQSVLTVLLYSVMRDLVREHQPDVIVSTHPIYLAPLRAVHGVGKSRIPVLTVVTDLVSVHGLWLDDVSDLLCVPTHKVYELALKSGLAPQNLKITGIPVHPDIAREKRDRAAIREELGWRPDLTTLLAVGGKRVEHLGGILKVLNHSGLAIQLAIVAGHDEELYRELQKVTWHPATHLYGFVDNMPALMHASDLIVCKAGGLIVTESLACSLPLLLIDVLPGQEVGNAEYVLAGGAGERAEDPFAVLEILYHWLDEEGALLAQCAENARELGKPCAAYRVAEEVWRMAGAA